MDFKYFKTISLMILFAWISFFPQPVQDRYCIYARVFLTIFLLILMLEKKNIKQLFSLEDWPLWLFLICLAAGTVSAIDKGIAWKAYFYLTITFFLLFYIGKGLYLSNNNRETINLVICICASLVALIGILELYFGKNILYENFIANPFYERYIRFNPRLMSTQFNPTVLGSFLLGCLPFNFYFFKNKSFFLRLLGISSSLLCLSTILLTFSRGVFLGLIAMLLFYLWKRRKVRFLIIFLFFLVFLIPLCSYQKNINVNRFGFNRMLIGSYDSIISEYRLNRIKMTVRILKEHPFFGIGFNHFRIRFNEYCDKKEKGKESYEFMIPDNMYLTFLTETGIVGTLGFFIFIISLLKGGLRWLKELEDDNKKKILLIALSALIGLFVNMGAYELFYWNNPYMLFCIICGFIQGTRLLTHEQRE
jgi:O-antigen ligase